MNQWINKSMNQWINESMNQWINESMNQWINESTNLAMNQWINESMNELTNLPMSQCNIINQPTDQSINQSINDVITWLNVWLCSSEKSELCHSWSSRDLRNSRIWAGTLPWLEVGVLELAVVSRPLDIPEDIE